MLVSFGEKAVIQYFDRFDYGTSIDLASKS